MSNLESSGRESAWGFHSAGSKNNPKIQFTAVYDVNEKAAQKVATRNQATNMVAYSTLEEFLHSNIDAVLIAVPHYLHEELVIKAAEAGKHVLCEKPMATTLEACDAMIEGNSESGSQIYDCGKPPILAGACLYS